MKSQNSAENAWAAFREILKKERPEKELVLLGHDYNFGTNGKNKDYQKAAQYYTMAMLKNNAEAVFNLALLYFHGKGGVKLDYAWGFNLLIKASKFPPKVNLLGNSTANNIGVAEAQYNIGRMYQNGIYVQKSEALSVDFYKQAAENESADAANNLGFIYMREKSFFYSLEKAEEMLLYAYKIGSYDASVNLVSVFLQKNEI